MKILVVEDEKKVASFIKRGLEEEGFSVDVAYDGEEGRYMAENNQFDLIMMDVMLPKKDGLTVVREIREHRITSYNVCYTKLLRWMGKALSGSVQRARIRAVAPVFSRVARRQ